MEAQITNTILMVRPATFRSNEETAVNNFYQNSSDGVADDQLLEKAQAEFDGFVGVMRSEGIEVITQNAVLEADTPDAHFPNNWVSFHGNGTVVLYPMFAPNRRRERNPKILDYLKGENFTIAKVKDITDHEEKAKFLEGTGSIAFDRVNRIAYCALSPRADKELFIGFCVESGYEPVWFTANQNVNGQRMPIYHTNVMMALGEGTCVICLDSIDDIEERLNVIEKLEGSGKKILDLTEAQLLAFAGNMLQVKDDEDQLVWVMSTAAFNSLTESQKEQLTQNARIIHSDLTTIEHYGGGSARCMMAEVFLERA